MRRCTGCRTLKEKHIEREEREMCQVYKHTTIPVPGECILLAFSRSAVSDALAARDGLAIDLTWQIPIWQG